MFKAPRLLLALFVSFLALPLVSASTARAASAKPQCVVSLSPTATETLYAIGAGPQVQAVDSDSDFPTSGLPSKRINALNPSVEAVIGLCATSASHPSTKPDLVIISYDANDIKEKLTGLGVKVVEQDAPTNLAGAYEEIAQLGALTGHVTAADALVASLKTTIRVDIASVPAHPTKRVTVYYELYPTYYSLTSDTFVGSLMKALGTVNVADAESTSADAGYPQLSAEYIASADPKLIFLADTVCCRMTPAKVAKRAGFAKVSAVAHGHVVNLNDDIASRWWPRLGTLMNELTAGVKSVLRDQKVWK